MANHLGVLTRDVKPMFACGDFRLLQAGLRIKTASYPAPAVYTEPGGEGGCVPGVQIQVDILESKEWLVVPLDSVKLTGHCGP